jgi:hypothetical protein
VDCLKLCVSLSDHGLKGDLFDSDKANMELLQAARRLRAEMELVTNELSTSEFQMQQARKKCLMLERQVTEQRSKEADLLANI